MRSSKATGSRSAGSGARALTADDQLRGRLGLDRCRGKAGHALRRLRRAHRGLRRHPLGRARKDSAARLRARPRRRPSRAALPRDGCSRRGVLDAARVPRRRRRRPGRGATRTRARHLRHRCASAATRRKLATTPARRRGRRAGPTPTRPGWRSRRLATCRGWPLRRRRGPGSRTPRGRGHRADLDAIDATVDLHTGARGRCSSGPGSCSRRTTPRTGRPCTWCAARTASASRRRYCSGARPIRLTCGRSGRRSRPTTPRARGRACARTGIRVP